MAIPDNQKIHFQVIIEGSMTQGVLTSAETRNIFYYRRTVFAPDLDYAELITALHAKWQAALLAATSVKWSHNFTKVRNIDSPFDAGLSAAGGGVGAVAGDALPAFASMLLSKTTALRGKRYRGRMFVPGVPESGQVDCVLTAGQLTLLTTLAGVLDDPVTTAAGLTYVPYNLSAVGSNVTIEPATIVGADVLAMTPHDRVTSTVSRRVRG